MASHALRFTPYFIGGIVFVVVITDIKFYKKEKCIRLCLKRNFSVSRKYAVKLIEHLNSDLDIVLYKPRTIKTFFSIGYSYDFISLT